MHRYPATPRYPQLLVLAALLMAAASIAAAQEPYHFPERDATARLSYDNSGVYHRDTVLHLCIAISRDGEYHLVRSTEDAPIERLQGKLTKEELSQLSKLLEAADFSSLSGDHGGLMRRAAESFAAEIPLRALAQPDEPGQSEPAAWRLRWMNGDGENPFPASVSSLVDWMKRFQPKDGQRFDYTDYPDVCPSGGLRFLQPSVAGNSQP
jgi:hypothetical protein